MFFTIRGKLLLVYEGHYEGGFNYVLPRSKKQLDVGN